MKLSNILNKYIFRSIRFCYLCFRRLYKLFSSTPFKIQRWY